MTRFMHPQHALAVSFVPRRQRPNQSLERTAAPLAGHGGSRSATVTGLGGRLARAAVVQFCRSHGHFLPAESFRNRCNSDFQPRTPAIKSSIAVLSSPLCR